MVRGVIILAVILAALMTTTPQALEELMRSVITIYLILSGFAVLFFQHRAWEFLRPLFLVGLALLFLPLLFCDLLAHMHRNLQSVFPYNVGMGPEWLFAPLAALIAFVLFRFCRWYRGRPQNTRPPVHRERERILPHVDLEDDLRD
jgi:hypothetical protein